METKQTPSSQNWQYNEHLEGYNRTRVIGDNNMEEDTFSKIWQSHGHILSQRHRELAKRMDDYDNEIYFPSLKTLRDRCAKLGHNPDMELQDNGLGWYWIRCHSCGDRAWESTKRDDCDHPTKEEIQAMYKAKHEEDFGTNRIRTS